MKDRLLLIAALVALGLAVFLSMRQPDLAQPGFHAWLSEDLGLDAAVVRCVDERVDDGLLGGVDPDRLTTDRLRREGLSAVPVTQRPLVGDVLIGCSVAPGTAGRP